ncbi:hypothetical protein K501DRAFT_248623 [Backusella circina FSU 941]|nr:hypothetical protein K501DRAFT_248623 [Backusella circina FSU 941]
MRMKQKAKKMKKDLFIIDTGDTHDGNGLSDITDPHGKLSQPLLTKIPYDLLTIGNHELYKNDIIYDTYNRFIPHWKNKYLAANVYFRDINTNKTHQMGQKYTYFKGKHGTRVLAYGFLFNFNRNGNMSFVSTVKDELKQPWFEKSIRKYSPDIITVIGHIGIRFPEFEEIINAIRKYKPDVPIAVLGGHTHIRDFVFYDKRAAGIESGKYFDTVGFLSVDCLGCASGNLTFNRRYLDQNRRTYINHAVDGKSGKLDTRLGLQLSEYISNIRAKYNLSQQIGYNPRDYRRDTRMPDADDSVYNLVLSEVMPKMLTDKSRLNPPYYIINTGGVRYDIFKGPFTLSTSYQVAPFENPYYHIEDVPIDVAEKILPAMNKQGEMRDDVQHLKEPEIPIPAFLGSKLPQDSQFVDIVIFPFFEKQIIDLLKSLTGKDWKAKDNYDNEIKMVSSTPNDSNNSRNTTKKNGVALKTPYSTLKEARKANTKKSKSTAQLRIGLAIIGALIGIVCSFPNLFNLFNNSTDSVNLSCQKYALMVDAGSTGSRIHVYKFHQCSSSEPVKLEEEVLFAQTIPGLSAYPDDPQKAAESLDVLLNDAVRLVPSNLQRKTPIAVKATAGLRLLGQSKGDDILKAVRNRLETSYPFPIVGGEDGVAIMDGRDEGVFAWITVNFLLGNFDSTTLGHRKHTAAVLDLGGGSTQIVFEPDFKEDGTPHELPDNDFKYLLQFGDKEYLLYQNSYLGYGLMEARKRMHKQSMDLHVEESRAIIHSPCLPKGLNWDYTKGDSPIQFFGLGSYVDCLGVADLMLNKDKTCEFSPCSFDGIYQPPISDAFKHGPIYIFSYFHDRTQPLGLPATFRLPELATLTESICNGEFLDNVTDVTLRDEILDRPEWCLDLSFIYRLLSYGYEIPSDRELTVAKKIDGVETGWCLGAAIAILNDNSLKDLD